MSSSSSVNTEQGPSPATTRESDDSFDVLEHPHPSYQPTEAHTAPYGWTPSILTRFPSPTALMSALRRRWLWAFCFGLIGAVLVGGIVWKLQPPLYQAEALLQIQSLPPDVVSSGPEAVTIQNYSSQQAILLKSPQLLDKVVALPKVQTAMAPMPPEAIRDWLINHLAVAEVGDKATVRVRLTSDSPHKLEEILTALLQVYRAEQLARQQRIIDDWKAKQQSDTALLARTKLQIVHTTYPRLFTVRDQLQTAKQETAQLHKQLQEAESERASVPPPQKQTGPSYDELAKADATLKRLTEQLNKVQAELDYYENLLVEGLKDPSLAPLLEERDTFRTQIEQRQRELRKKVVVTVDPNKGRRERLDTEIANLEQELSEAVAKERALVERERTLAQASPDLKGQREHDAEIAMLEAKIQQRQLEIDSLQSNQESPAWLKDLGLAVAPSSEHHRRKISATILGSSCGFLFWAGAVGFVEFRRRRLTSVNEVSQGLEIPLLGTIPPLPGKQLALLPSMWENRDDAKSNAVCEAVDVLRTLLLRRIGEGPCVVMISSATSGEGKTSLACQLSLSLARAWRKTLLVDADLRKPGTHQLFHLAQEPGLSEVLRGDVEVDDIVQSTPTSRLWMVPAGQWDSFAIQSLAQERAVFLFEHFRKQYDFVIVDGGPVLPSADALLTGQHCDAVILTARETASRLPAVHTAHERLLSLELPVLGCVVVGSHGDMGCLHVNYP